VERVVRRRCENAGRSLVALLRKQFARDAHFHVVGLGGKQQQGFVLRFPPETSDGAVVGAAVYVAAQDRVRVAGNAERSLQGRIGLQVGEDGRIRDRFDQAGSKKRRRYSEDDVGIPALDRKSTRLNSSHVSISYAVFCLKKKNKITKQIGKNNNPPTIVDIKLPTLPASIHLIT